MRKPKTKIIRVTKEIEFEEFFLKFLGSIAVLMILFAVGYLYVEIYSHCHPVIKEVEIYRPYCTHEEAQALLTPHGR